MLCTGTPAGGMALTEQTAAKDMAAVNSTEKAFATHSHGRQHVWVQSATCEVQEGELQCGGCLSTISFVTYNVGDAEVQ